MYLMYNWKHSGCRNVFRTAVIVSCNVVASCAYALNLSCTVVAAGIMMAIVCSDCILCNVGYTANHSIEALRRLCFR